MIEFLEEVRAAGTADLLALLDCWLSLKELCDLACRADLDLDGHGQHHRPADAVGELELTRGHKPLVDMGAYEYRRP